jgi:hypothetical protein
LLVCARAGNERAATPAVNTAPVFRKVRRVTGVGIEDLPLGIIMVGSCAQIFADSSKRGIARGIGNIPRFIAHSGNPILLELDPQEQLFDLIQF